MATRETGPNGPARNCSRRDGIRAGAVTGPWRSGTFAAQGPAAHRRDGGAGVSRQPAVRPGAEARAGALAAAPVAMVPSVRAVRALGRSRVLFAAGALGALALLAGLVQGSGPHGAGAASSGGLAFLRGDAVAGGPQGVGGDARSVPVPAQRPALASASASGSDFAAGAAERSLRVRAGAGADTGRLAEALAGAGWGDVAYAPLSLRVAASRIGYYHGEDRDAAEALARLVETHPDAAAIAVRDYGALLPRPPRGTIDLWIAL